jgi:hypothetical protein
MEDTWFDSFKACISDSTIGVFYPGLGNEEPNEYDMNNVTILKGLGFKLGAYTCTGGLNLHGNIRFGENFNLNKTVVDGYAIINREYTVSCTSTSGPAAEVSLVAMNGNNTLWEGESNPEGIAIVPIRFVHIFKVIQPNNTSGPTLIQADNMTETFTLHWSKGDNEGSITLGLTSDTPVMIEITKKTGYMSLLLPLSVVLLIIIIMIVKQEKSRNDEQSVRSSVN